MRPIKFALAFSKEIFFNNKIEKCDLMKIDIEGGKYSLFYNLAEKL